VTATYDAAVTTRIHRWLIALAITLAALMLVGFGFIVLMGMFMGEYWCEDRSPWWGPPTDPNSECSGLLWAEKHPGEYPWTLPR
jgi:hypothetical protein